MVGHHLNVMGLKVPKRSFLRVPKRDFLIVPKRTPWQADGHTGGGSVKKDSVYWLIFLLLLI